MLRTLSAALLLSLMMTVAAQAKDEINTTFFGEVAIEGYDTVAYFTQQKAVEGSAEHEFSWRGATWRFSSAENKQLFADDPERYAPSYGGYCAYAVSQNKTAGIEPEQWTIVDGRLFLNYNADVQARWLGDRDTFIEAADKNWPGVIE
jgi:YHS domain-containing protein